MARQRVVINGRFLTQSVTGVQRVARELVTALDAHLVESTEANEGYEFAIFAPSGFSNDLNLKVIKIVELPFTNGHLWEQLRLPSVLKGSDILVSLCNTGTIFHSRQIVLVHDAAVFSMPYGYSTAFRAWYRFLHRMLKYRQVLISTVSEFSRGELCKYLGLEPHQIDIIPNGVDHAGRVEPSSSIVRRIGLSAGEYVLAVGSIHPNKNLRPLLAIGDNLAHEGFRLVIVGESNARVFAEGRVASAVEQGNAIFTGRVSDAELNGLYVAAGCFVFPSIYEGFGLPPLEAMAMSCPVVASNRASIPEILGKAAVYADPTSESALLDAIMGVLRQPEQRATLIALGAHQAAQYTWAKSASKLLSCLKKFN